MPNTIPSRGPVAVLASLALLLLPFVAPSQASAGISRFEWKLMSEINAVRAQHGLAAVRHRGMLSGAAARHSSRLRRSGRLYHSSTSSLARRAGGPVGEVIAWSSRRTSARSVVRQWMNSPPHRGVLLDSKFRTVGVGASKGRRGLFVTADFAGR